MVLFIISEEKEQLPENKVVNYEIVEARDTCKNIRIDLYVFVFAHCSFKPRKEENIQENLTIHWYDVEKNIKDFILSGQFREDEQKGIEVPFVALESILAATDNFLVANKLGQGGFGPVYRVKRL